MKRLIILTNMLLFSFFAFGQGKYASTTNATGWVGLELSVPAYIGKITFSGLAGRTATFDVPNTNFYENIPGRFAFCLDFLAISVRTSCIPCIHPPEQPIAYACDHTLDVEPAGLPPCPPDNGFFQVSYRVRSQADIFPNNQIHFYANEFDRAFSHVYMRDRESYILGQAWESSWNGSNWVGSWKNQWEQLAFFSGSTTTLNPIWNQRRNIRSFRIRHFFSHGSPFGGYQFFDPGLQHWTNRSDSNCYDNSIIVHLHSLPLATTTINVTTNKNGLLDYIVIPFNAPLDPRDTIIEIFFLRDSDIVPLYDNKIDGAININSDDNLKFAVYREFDSKDFILRIRWKSQYIQESEGIETITLRVRHPNDLIATHTPTNPRCYNDSTGSISISISEGRPLDGGEYDIEVVKMENGLHIIENTRASRLTISNLPNGIYIISVSDRDVTLIDTVRLFTAQIPLNFNTISPLKFFPNDSTSGLLREGSITITDTNSAYRYSLIFGEFSSDPIFSSNKTFPLLKGGVYTLWVMDSTLINRGGSRPGDGFPIDDDIPIKGFNLIEEEEIDLPIIGNQEPRGCAHNIKIRIVEDTLKIPKINIVKQAYCSGSIGILEGIPVNPPVGYTYFWKKDDTIYHQQSLQIQGIPGIYMFCIEYEGYEVCVTEKLGVSSVEVILTNPKHLDCYNDFSGEITLSVSGGSKNYTFESNLPNVNQLTEPTHQILKGLAAGEYNITVKDVADSTCFGFAKITLTQPEIALNISSSFGKMSDCFGGSDGFVGITVAGGTPTYTYVWKDHNNAELNNNSSILENIEHGSFTVIVTDDKGCEIDTTLTLDRRIQLQLEYEIQHPRHSSYDYNKFKGDTANGKILLKPFGGVAPYIFYINRIGIFTVFGDTIIKNLDTGVYVVHYLRDGNGCTLDTSFQLTRTHEPLRVSIEELHRIPCHGDKKGELKANVEDGAGGYTFAWRKLPNTTIIGSAEILTSIGIGTYEVTVTDAMGVISKDSFLLREPNPLKITSWFAEKSRCYGLSDGSVGVEISGGRAPYIYKWNNLPETFQKGQKDTLKNIERGDFTVIIWDSAMLCSVSKIITLDTQAKLRLEIIPTNPTHGYYDLNTLKGEIANGQLVLNPSGGFGTFTIEVNGIPVSNLENTMMQNLDTGVYRILLKDANNCEVDTMAKLIRLPPLRAIINQVQHIFCKNDSTGILEVVVSGGVKFEGDVEPYNYVWIKPSEGSGNVIGHTAKITNLYAEIYEVRVTDAEGKISVYSFLLNEPDELKINNLTADNVSGWGVSDGKIVATVSGGTLPYVFTWTDTETFHKISPDSLVDIPTRWYWLTLTDSNKCLAFDSVFVPTPDSLTHIYTIIHCTYLASKNGVIPDHIDDGKITVTVRGGVKPYTFSWLKKDDAIPTQGTIIGDSISTISDLGGGIYTLLVTDRNGYYFRDTFEVIQRKPLFSSIEQTQIVKCNGEENAELLASFKDGTPGFYRVSWLKQRTGQELWDTVQQTIFSEAGIDILANIGAGKYRVEVRDTVCNEISFYEYVVLQPEKIVVQNEVQILTKVGYDDAWIRVSVQGGREPYSYFWIKNDMDFSRDLFIENLSAGHYIFLVLDSTNCPASSLISISPITDIEVEATITDRSYRVANQGVLTTQDTTPDGKIELRITGGIEPYIVNWMHGDTGKIIANLMQGIYSATIIDAVGNEAYRNYTVRQEAPLIVTIDSIVQISCYGYADGLLRASVDGGIKPYTFLWNTPNLDTTSLLTDLLPGLYTVLVTDSMGRQSNFSASITQPDSLVVLTNASDVSCWGYQNGSFTLTPTGGTSPYIFSRDESDTVWQTQGQTWTISPTTIHNTRNTLTAANLNAGFYHVKVTDQKGCSQNVSVELFTPQLFYLFYTLKNSDYEGQTIDRNAQILNNGSIRLHPQGGQQPYRFRWINPVSTDSILSNLSGGVYNVQIRDANNCLIEQRFTIRQPEILRTSIRLEEDIFCADGTGRLSVGSISGGIPPYRILWSTGETTTQIGNLSPEVYILQVFDSTNIEASARFTFAQPTAMQIALTSIQTPRCFGESDGLMTVSTIGGRAPFRYAWNTGNASTNLTNVSANTYTVVVTDANNCVAQRNFVLTQPERLRFVADIHHPICFGDSNASISIQPFGGTSPYTYLWLNNPNQQTTIFNLKEGVYRLRLEDDRFCRIDTMFTIINPAKLGIQNLDYNKILCYEQFFKPDPKPDTLNYFWTTSSGFFANERRPILYSGTYFVQAFNQYDCFASETITITEASDTVIALYLISSDIYKDELTTIVHISSPAPDSTLWIIPENVEIIELNYEYADLIFRDTGEHIIGKIAYKGGCTDYFERIFVVNEEREFALQNKSPSLFDYIVVSPNPTSDIFELAFKVRNNASLLMRLFKPGSQYPIRTIRKDVRAHLIYKETFSVQGYAKGTYILTVQSDAEMKVFKIIVI